MARKCIGKEPRTTVHTTVDKELKIQFEKYLQKNRKTLADWLEEQMKLTLKQK